MEVVVVLTADEVALILYGLSLLQIELEKVDGKLAEWIGTVTDVQSARNKVRIAEGAAYLAGVV